MKLVELKGYDLIMGKTIDAEANPMVKEMTAFGKRLMEMMKVIIV